MNITREQLSTGFTGETGYCYVHARAGIAPNGRMLMTTQKLRLTGCDVFSGLEMASRPSIDAPWTPIRASAGLRRRVFKDDVELVMCDATPMYHRASRTFINLGHTAYYRNDELYHDKDTPRGVCWSYFDDAASDWSSFQTLQMPAPSLQFGNGSGQSVELPDGTLLVPAYGRVPKVGNSPSPYFSVASLHCAFENNTLRLLDYGNILTVESARGLCEGSIAHLGNKFFMCLRHDLTSFVSVSEDGLHYSAPVELTFDDGTLLGTYNTQQHWLSQAGKLYLVYTRKGANNDHVFRHRAPLFIGEFDTDRLCVIRATEQIAVPERGARLGNFTCFQRSEEEAFIMAAEWMQTTEPDCSNFRRCMSYGSDNSIWIAKVTP